MIKQLKELDCKRNDRKRNRIAKLNATSDLFGFGSDYSQLTLIQKIGVRFASSFLSFWSE